MSASQLIGQGWCDAKNGGQALSHLVNQSVPHNLLAMHVTRGLALERLRLRRKDMHLDLTNALSESENMVKVEAEIVRLSRARGRTCPTGLQMAHAAA